MTKERLYVGDFVSIDAIGEIVRIDKKQDSSGDLGNEFTIKFNQGIAYMPENCLTPAPLPQDAEEQYPPVEQPDE
jgi:hypothetical protein